MEERNSELLKILDTQSKVMVGSLMRRIEILDQENSLTPTLLKALLKERIYEGFRSIKTIISIGRVVFVQRKEKR